MLIYALMAAGGDMGSAIVPQLVGMVTDTVIKNNGFMFMDISAVLIEELAMILYHLFFLWQRFYLFLELKNFELTLV